MVVLLFLTLSSLMQFDGARNYTRMVIQQLFSNPRVPSFESRQHLWALLNQENLTSGVEIGVERGITSQLTLSIWTSCHVYTLVDAWAFNAGGKETGHLDHYAKTGHSQAAHNEKFNIAMRQKIQRASCTQSFAGARQHEQCGVRINLCRNLSHICANQYEDSSFDYIFVDALHDRKAVLRDLRMWWPKLKIGGIMAGDDYFGAKESFQLFPGKYASVEEVARTHPYRLNYDGSIDRSGRFAKGAADDFFGCIVDGEDERQVPDLLSCPHLRFPTVVVTRDERTFAVRK